MVIAITGRDNNMKKALLITMILGSFMFVKAQNYLLMNIEDIENQQVFELCFQDYDSAVIVDNTCDYSYNYHWFTYSLITGEYYYVNEPVLTIIPDELNYGFFVEYLSCERERFVFEVWFHGFSLSEPWFPEYVWKHEDETITLVAPDNTSYYMNPYYWQYEWSTGESEKEVEVADPGIYWVRLYNNCGEAFDSVEVRNGVEIGFVSTDLATNLNQVFWTVDDAQSAYIAEVNIYRNGQLIGTVPYSESSFLDEIGSEATQWQYHVVGVTALGEECPVPSYWERPIHLDHLQGQSNHVLQWTSYEAENDASVMAYRIYDWVEGELSLVEEVGYFANTYNYNPDDFIGDAVVAAVFSSGELSYSNRVATHLGISENDEMAFNVYPNPTDGILVVETFPETSLTTNEYRITNLIGQTVQTGSLNAETQQIDVSGLPQGMYFISVGEGTRKFVKQ